MKARCRKALVLTSETHAQAVASDFELSLRCPRRKEQGLKVRRRSGQSQSRPSSASANGQIREFTVDDSV